MHSKLLLLPMALLAASAAATAEPVMVFRRNPIPHHASSGPLDNPGGVLAFLSRRQNSVACDDPDADQSGNGRTDCCRFYRNGATGGCCFSGCCGTQDTCDPAATQELGACICVGTEAECGGGGGGAFTGTKTATSTEGAASTMMSEASTSTDAAAAAATDSMMMPSASSSSSSEADAATPAATTGAAGAAASSGPSSGASASAGAGGGSSGAGKNVGAVTGLGLVMAAVGFAAAML